MIEFYFNFSPNPMKVGLFLEEAGLEYKPHPVDTFRGEQFSDKIIALNPNSKVPIIVDGSDTIFDSSAILLYLGEKYNQFLPSVANRPALLSWLMFIASGLGPYSGQSVHFRHYAPAPKEYAEQRYSFEARRHFAILDRHLTGRDWMVGDHYSIIDMSIWAWCRHIDLVLGPDGQTQFPSLMRVVEKIEAREAAQKVIAFPENFSFQMNFDADARRNMFRHIDSEGH